MGVASWQLTIAFVVIRLACCFSRPLDLGAAGWPAWLALTFVGVMGNGGRLRDVVRYRAGGAGGYRRARRAGIPVIGVFSTSYPR